VIDNLIIPGLIRLLDAFERLRAAGWQSSPRAEHTDTSG
jgi:hypothetical protein